MDSQIGELTERTKEQEQPQEEGPPFIKLYRLVLPKWIRFFYPHKKRASDTQNTSTVLFAYSEDNLGMSVVGGGYSRLGKFPPPATSTSLNSC